jgi:catechol 2,3-dioxygenase-like lactoylglutathione lyase family enzyme
MTRGIDPADLAKVGPWLRGPCYDFLSGEEMLVPVRDVKRSKQFYVEMLNSRLVSESETEVRIDVGPRPLRLVLKLACRGEWPASIAFPILCHTFYGGGTRTLYECYQQMGITIAEPFREVEDGVRKFTITDPDGHRISFLGPP